jgi:integrase
MPLRVEVPKGRASWYIRGTVKAGRRSRSVYESTGIGAGDPNARREAEKAKKRREPELVAELLAESDPTPTVTFTEAAADYGSARERARLARNPALAGVPDKEMEYVAKWITFLRSRGVADIPLFDACAKPDLEEAIGAYFDELHIAKGNKRATMQREADVFHTIMNHAESKGWAPEDYPRCPIQGQSVFEQPVNKWLYEAEVNLFIKCAPNHLLHFVAGVFATGIRGGELIFCSRRRPDYNDPNSTGVSLEPGHEHIFLGYTKGGKPFLRPLPDWYAQMLRDYLETRDDDYDALFLTELGEPYLRPKKQRGFIVKTAWKGMRKRVVRVIERLARMKATQGDDKAASYLRGRAEVCAAVTPHWGRHNVASHILRKGRSEKEAQRAGGWASAAMLKRYAHLSSEAEKELANEMTFKARAIRVQSKKKA